MEEKIIINDRLEEGGGGGGEGKRERNNSSRDFNSGTSTFEVEDLQVEVFG